MKDDERSFASGTVSSSLGNAKYSIRDVIHTAKSFGFYSDEIKKKAQELLRDITELDNYIADQLFE